MTAIDLFGVFVRITGFWVFLYGFALLISGIAMGYGGGGNKEPDKQGETSTAGYLIFGVLYLVAGLMIMSTADSVIDYCY